MEFCRMKATVILMVALACVAQTAMAQSSGNPLDTRIYKNGVWLGGGINWTEIDPDGGDDDNQLGGNIGIGYQFLNYFGVNARYKWLGSYDFGGPFDDVDVDGYTLGASAGYPITQRVGIIGGIGYYDFDLDAGGQGDGSEDGLYLSGGIATEIGRIVIQPQIVWYDTDDADVYGLEVNAYWKFEMGN
jgi:hypothetical protein